MLHDRTLKAVTLQDVARASGVSRTTVSNAFNRPDQLSPELRSRVLATAKAMGYSGPNPMARMLRTGRSGAIGLVFPESLPYAFSDPVAIAFLQGVSSVCEQAKASLLIVPTLESNVEATIQQAAVDGFLVYCMPNDSDAVMQVLERRLPVVAVDETIDRIPSVRIDDYQAAHQAAAHLLDLHHQRLVIFSMDLIPDAYIGWTEPQRIASAVFQNTLDRLCGYQDAIREAGLNPDTVPIAECPPRKSTTDAFDLAVAMLNQQPRPTGVLAMCDLLAIAVLQAAEHLGLRVPDDLSVVGFDGIPLAAQIRPTLTTIQQPLVEKGVVAAEILLSDRDNIPSRILETRLIIRASTGAAPPV